jgi:hypothetical protein
MQVSLVTSTEFLRFLIAAKQVTYAGQGDAASVSPLLPGSKQLEFTEGEFLYRDIYVGMLRFVGQEIVYLSGQPVWSMSYSGGLFPGTPPTSAKAAYAFLRLALRALPPEFPVRGPALLETENLRYVCQHSGSIDLFHGSEVISEDGLPIYELHFSGGKLV